MIDFWRFSQLQDFLTQAILELSIKVYTKNKRSFISECIKGVA